MSDLISIFEAGRKIAEDYLAKTKLCELTLTNTTLTYIGGHKAKPFSLKLNIFEKPRTTSIKGLWKWWLRAYIAGAIIHKTQLEPNWKKLIDLVNNYMGSTNKASEIIVTIDDVKILKTWKTNLNELERILGDQKIRIRRNIYNLLRQINIYEQSEKASSVACSLLELFEIPRLRLLMIGKNAKELHELLHLYPPEGVRVRLSVYTRRKKLDKDNTLLLIGSLITSLIFNGFGAITRRGFGSVKINVNYCTDPDFKKEIKKIYASRKPEDLRKHINDLINITLKAAERIINKGGERQIVKCPLHPAIVPEKFFSIDVIAGPLSQNSHLTILKIIGKATLKSTWKEIFIRMKRLTTRPHKISGRELHTWALGLPRSQSDLGYYADSIIGRRPSPIGATTIFNDESYWIVSYKFCSLDWPDKLSHISTHRDRKKLVWDIPLVDPFNPNKRFVNLIYPYELVPKAIDVAYNVFKKVIRSETSHVR